MLGADFRTDLMEEMWDRNFGILRRSCFTVWVEAGLEVVERSMGVESEEVEVTVEVSLSVVGSSTSLPSSKSSKSSKKSSSKVVISGKGGGGGE